MSDEAHLRNRKNYYKLKYAHHKGRAIELESMLAFQTRKARSLRTAVNVMGAILLFLSGTLMNGATSKQIPAPTSAYSTQEAKILKDSPLLASVKMNGCSATVLGDPLHFREYPQVLVVSAAHCVSSIGEQRRFYNSDGRSEFIGTLIAVDRSIDCALFTAPSKDVHGAVWMSDKPAGESFDHSLWLSVNYPAATGGPNLKTCKPNGTTSREGAEEGYSFIIDDKSKQHGGHHSGGGSGGGMFVRTAEDEGWNYYGVTSHGMNGDFIGTTKFARLKPFIEQHMPQTGIISRIWRRDCRDGKCPDKKPGTPPITPPPKPPGEEPDWWNPNVPVPEPLPNPKPDDPPVPEPPKEDNRLIEILRRLEIVEKAKGMPGPQGPEGPRGKDGSNGTNATVDQAALTAKAEAVAKATVEALIKDGKLTGPKGDSPSIDVDSIVKKVIENMPPITVAYSKEDESPTQIKPGGKLILPPVKMEIYKNGRSYVKSKPLGQTLSMEVSTVKNK